MRGRLFLSVPVALGRRVAALAGLLVLVGGLAAGCGDSGGGAACEGNGYSGGNDYYEYVNDAGVWKDPGRLTVFLPTVTEDTHQRVSEVLRNLTRESMRVWETATEQAIQFSFEGTSAGAADIAIRFLARTGPGEALGQATTTFRGRQLIQAEIAVYVDRVISGPGNVHNDFRNVIAHETGHALGLTSRAQCQAHVGEACGHSPSPNDLMYYRITGRTTPSERDLNTLRRLYPCLKF